MLEKDFIVFEEMLFYYSEILKDDTFLVPTDYLNKGKKEQDKAAGFLYDIYNYLIENPDDNLYDVISYLNIELGNYYLSINKLKEAECYFDILLLKYKYLSNSEKEDKGFHLFEGLRTYKMENFSEEKQVIILNSILKLFIFLIKKDEYKELEQYQVIFGKEDFIEKDILRSYYKIVLIHILKTNYTRGTLKEKDKLITKLEREVCHKKLILEKILTESIEKNGIKI